MDPDASQRLSRSYTVHQPDLDEPVWRLVCSWATTDVDVEGVLTALR